MIGDKDALERSKVEEEWDQYWTKASDKSKSAYDLIAHFYRRYLIKRTLNHFIKKNFQKGEKLLHAGCGSGEVDEDVTKLFPVTALDISNKALERYKHNNPDTEVINGDIFSLPFPAESFQGIYNLGVMEHFTKEQIHEILNEFRRVIKKNGKIVLFWPPSFGATVIALDSIHFFLHKILRSKTILHPLEISRIQSRKHARKILQQAGFTLEKFYFGPKDGFTHAILVASPNAHLDPHKT